MQKILSNMREDIPKKIGDYDVLRVRDYKEKKIYDLKSGTTGETILPVSNVLYFELSDHAWACVRPSGTEPKVKLYMGVKGLSEEDALRKIESLKTSLVKLVLNE